MTGLSDAAVNRLRQLGSWPEFESGRYSVLRELGRGGMGIVYLATDEELGREVAIKIPNAVHGTRLDHRLQLEARALATLEHPGIVPIHDAGRLVDGRLFYVMKRVEGRTLRQYLNTVRDLGERLRVFERICEPVAFAHARGVIHRDLKPENVMVGAFGEVMVMDWGTVKTLPTADCGLPIGNADCGLPIHNADCGLSIGSPESAAARRPQHTDSGMVIGTPGFMAPEQARGTAGAVDRRADVYGLGAILFLLLSDEVPVPGAEPLIALQRRRVPRPLAAICARALETDPEYRYQAVDDLRDEVARYRAGRAVDAYAETPAERILRFVRTYRTAILLVLGYITMRALVALLAGW